MSWLLPFTLLLAFLSLFGISWIVFDYDPQSSPWYILTGMIFFIFILVLCTLGLLIYFVRTRRYRRYSANWYFKTSFKLAFFAALLVAIYVTLSILKIVNTFNVLAAFLGVGLFALWAYLG